MAKVIVYPRFDQSLTWDSITSKFSVQIQCAADTSTGTSGNAFGGAYEFNWTDSLESILEGIINLAVTNAGIEGLTISASDVKVLMWRILG